MRRTFLIAAAALIFAAPSQAKLLYHHPPHASRIMIHASQLRNLSHSRYVCANGAHANRLWHCRAVRWLEREAAETAPVPSRPAHYRAWLCIHRYEGSWTDTGAPYYGGLQFGWSEWKRFGGRYAPTADQASPLEQMWAAEAYYRLSGFTPWPNTARACGLL